MGLLDNREFKQRSQLEVICPRICSKSRRLRRLFARSFTVGARNDELTRRLLHTVIDVKEKENWNLS